MTGRGHIVPRVPGHSGPSIRSGFPARSPRLQRLLWYKQKLRHTLNSWDEERRIRERFPHARIEPGVTIINPDRLVLGEGATLQTGAVLHCGGYEWSGGRGSIKIGAGAVIAQHTVMYGAGEIEIGEYFYCGPDCMIFSSQERVDMADGGGGPENSHLLAKTTLHDECRLGVAAIVTHGCTLERGAILGGNALLLANTRIPSFEFWGGNPARKLADLNRDTWRTPRLNG